MMMVTALGILVAMVSILATFGLSLIIFLKKRNQFWAKRAVAGPEPELFFGNFKDTMLVKMTEAETVNLITQKFKNKKVIGIYNLWKPVFLVKNYEVGKRVIEQDADYFIDHPPILSDELTDFAFYSVFTMEGEVWKTRRQIFSKLFTPKKVKEYLEDMRPGLSTLVRKLDGEMEVLDALTSFTAQTSVQVLYGLDLSRDSARTEELIRMLSLFIHPPPTSIIKMLAYNVWPGIFKLFKVGVMPAEIWHYASRLYDDMVEARTSLNFERDDGLDAIMKMQKEGGPTFDKIEYKEAVGHMFQFLIGAVHTGAVVMSHVMLKLSQYPEVQNKLKVEVDEILKGAETVTYEHISQMKYLDYVMQETTRLVPVTGLLKRTCNKDYELTEGVTVRRGEDVWVDIYSIHLDPLLFPEPLKFMPERWASPALSEAGANYAFGRGPRICIGKRMAELQAKLMLSTVLSKFDILPSDKNSNPIKFNPKTIILTSIPSGGAWVKFKPRN